MKLQDVTPEELKGFLLEWKALQDTYDHPGPEVDDKTSEEIGTMIKVLEEYKSLL